jgi:hypothetical protein
MALRTGSSAAGSSSSCRRGRRPARDATNRSSWGPSSNSTIATTGAAGWDPLTGRVTRGPGGRRWSARTATATSSTSSRPVPQKGDLQAYFVWSVAAGGKKSGHRVRVCNVGRRRLKVWRLQPPPPVRWRATIDLREVAPWLKTGRADAIGSRASCGCPIRCCLAPGPLPSGSGWSFELKWDGFRAIVST